MNYFRYDKLNPIIQNSLARTEATKYWTDLSKQYNQIPFVKKVTTDLALYATQKAMEGLFYEIAKEELKIRQNSGLRSSDLLKKVFGYADKNKNNLQKNKMETKKLLLQSTGGAFCCYLIHLKQGV